MVSASLNLLTGDLFRELETVLGKDITPERAVLTTSFSKEDQLLTWAVLEAGLDVQLVSLDTGCLFPATQQTWRATEHHFGIEIEALHPERKANGALSHFEGTTSIYSSVEARKSCCHLRKIEPLKKACAGKEWWLTGLRKAQSGNRSAMPKIEDAPDWGLKKFHPLLDWSDESLEAAVAMSGVPINPLYSMGYKSIGCAPCTRPVLPGEDARAGRWWWEQSSKECGLHRG